MGLLALAVVVLVGDRLTGGRLSGRGRHAVEGKATTLEIPGVGSVPLFLNPSDPVITQSILTEGIWEASDTHWFVKAVRPGDVVVDAGANIGYYTILASRLVGPTGRVYAFEPDPTAFEILRRNVRLNGADNVVAEQKALSNANTTLELFIASDNKGDDRIYQPKGEQRPSIKVPAVRMDDYLRGKVEHVDMVKIDTQGAEAVIIEGMAETIRANEQMVMIVEFWPSGLAGLGSDAAALLKRLRADDFRFYNLGPGTFGPGNIGEIDEATLLAQHTLANGSFTNLFCVRGYARSLAQPANDKLIPPTDPAPGRPTRVRS
jgi:FkbM family methyltransferase